MPVSRRQFSVWGKMGAKRREDMSAEELEQCRAFGMMSKNRSITDEERQKLREAGKKGAAAFLAAHPPKHKHEKKPKLPKVESVKRPDPAKASLTNEQREFYRACGRRGAEKSRALAAQKALQAEISPEKILDRDGNSI